MAKLRLYGCTFFLLLILSSGSGFSQYRLKVICIDRDSLFTQENLNLTASFRNQTSCLQYIIQLPVLLQTRGFAGASIDSIRFDSLQARVQLYLGDSFTWAHIHTRRADAPVLNGIGWIQKNFEEKPFNFRQFQQAQQKMLDWLENNGYPFARVSLDSIRLAGDSLTGSLKIDRGPLYRIDSVRVYGSARISVDFLQRYLNIPDGSIYCKEKLLAISKRIRDLPYIEEQQGWTLTLLGTGSILNLYLRSRKSSQIDVLVGLLPNNSQLTSNGLLVTGEATINLKDALGNGESIGLNWQQIQPQSPRLNLYFQQPYIFKSPYGLNTSFDLFKKDSSYININFILGMQYISTATKSGTIFFQSSSSNLLTLDTPTIIATHQLPSEADLSSLSLGIDYQFNNTNYRFNPLRGNEFQFTGSVGTRKVKPNAEIQKLIDPADSSFNFSSLYDSIPLSSYEFRIRVAGAHYFQVSQSTTLKLGLNAGVFQSPNSYRNEVFQIGGYALLRGFDEESILASQYAVGTLEYRLLIAQNSFLFSFIDMGWAKNNIPGYSLNDTYIGVGFGLAFQTKAGIFNMSLAVGKTDETGFDLRDAKIHLGYVNFF
jgi:outer membrane protein assembly factor BamA